MMDLLRWISQLSTGIIGCTRQEIDCKFFDYQVKYGTKDILLNQIIVKVQSLARNKGSTILANQLKLEMLAYQEQQEQNVL